MGKMYGGRYEIEEKIGEGGMGIVYKAKDTLLNRTVAIKVLREQFASDEGFIQRFRREAQAAASLSHQNIVSIYDVGKEGDHEEYIVMEYVKGRTLKDIIRMQGLLPADQAINIARQIGEALAHAHANHIIHRDIKPQNILINEDGRAKVTDFGIARAASSVTLTQTGDIVGSVHYLSPEQAKGSQTNEQSDIYSLGIIFYEMITGKVPYDGDTPITIALKHIQEEAELPGKVISGISPGLDAIIMKCLAKSVEDRYQSASEFLSDIERILTGQTVVWLRGNGEDPSGQTQIHKGLKNRLNAGKNDKLARTGPLAGKRRKMPLPAFISLIVLGIILLSSLAFGLYMYNPEVTVPDLRGITVEEAGLKLEEKGLLLGNVGYGYSDDVEANKVMSQGYPPNSKIKTGRAVDLTVSQGMEILTFPDLTTTNPLEDDAVSTIKAAGFTGEITIDRTLYPAVEKGRVIAQNPMPGALWAKNGKIKIVVSSGEEGTVAVMPDVTSIEADKAKNILVAYNLVVSVETEKSDLYPPEAVIRTTPAPGKAVLKGSEVTIVVSEGPGPGP